MKTELAEVAFVPQTTQKPDRQNLVISLSCFTEDGKEMYKDITHLHSSLTLFRCRRRIIGTLRKARRQRQQKCHHTFTEQYDGCARGLQFLVHFVAVLC